MDVAELRGDDRMDVRHKRRASDRAEERVDRAANHGDAAAMRIAGAQLDGLLRRRATYRKEAGQGGKAGSARLDRR